MSGAKNHDAGWTFFRALGLIFGVLAMAGFGFCSLCGAAAFGGQADIELILLIVSGLAIAFLGFLLAAWMVRLIRHGRRSSDGDEKPWRH